MNSKSEQHLGAEAEVPSMMSGPDKKDVEGATLVQCHAPLGMLSDYVKTSPRVTHPASTAQ